MTRIDPTLSVIIPTYNRHALLRRAVASVLECGAGLAQVIVVDQTPGCRPLHQQLLAEFPGIDFVALPKANLPAARNAGVARSKAQIVFFLDDDAIVRPGCFEAHLAAHGRESVEAVAGRIRNVNGPAWPKTPQVTRINPETGEGVGNFDLDYEGPVLYACGAHMSIKRSALEKTGGFDAHFRGNALFEETDFFFRLRKSGGLVWYTPQAVVDHLLEPAGGCRKEQGYPYLLDRIHNHALFYFRHVRRTPSKSFLAYMRNLIEFASRSGSGHDLSKAIRCLTELTRAYLHHFSVRADV